MTSRPPQRQAPQSFAMAAFQKRDILSFEVVAGAHEGATLVLDKQDYRIGSSPDADIVLSDPGVAPEHAMLRIEQGAVRIGAIGADVVIDKTRLPMARGRRVSLPVNFTLGSAQIRISGRGEPKPSLIEQLRREAFSKPIVAAAILTVIVLSAAVFEAIHGSGIADAGLPQAAEDVTTKVGPTVDDAAVALRARLVGAKIGTLLVSSDNGRLLVAGKLVAQQIGEWSEIQRWFDQKYGTKIVLTTAINQITPAHGLPELHGLQAIWYGDRPYIVVDGRRYSLGSMLDNGWTIHEIGEIQLVLTKDGETRIVRYP